MIKYNIFLCQEKHRWTVISRVNTRGGRLNEILKWVQKYTGKLCERDRGSAMDAKGDNQGGVGIEE